MPAPQLILNAAPLIAPSEKLPVHVFPYDEEKLSELRTALADRALVKRDRRDDKIVVVPLLSDLEVNGQRVEIDLAERPDLMTNLASEAVLRFMREAKGYSILSARPLQVLAEKPANLFPQKAGLPEWIQKRVALVFETRLLGRPGKPAMPILLCDVRVKNVIGAPCSTLAEKGVPLVGRYVCIRRANHDARVQDYAKVVGRVVSLDGGTLQLDDCADGYSAISADQAWLEARRENVALCVRTFLGEHAERVLEEVDRQEAEVRRGDNRARLIKASLDYLRQQPLSLAPGVPLTLGQVMEASNKQIWFPKVGELRKPNLVFDPSGSQFDTWNQRGIDTRGPYDQRDFTPKELRIAIICQAQHQGEVGQFIAKFLDGMPSIRRQGRNGMPDLLPFEKGFLRRFALSRPRVDTFVAADASADSYLAACRQAVDAAVEGGFDWNIAFVQIGDDFRELPNRTNPYFVTKGMLLRQRIHVQEITLNTIRLEPFPLACSMSNISLASYAKLGGIPWLLKSTPNLDHELVIGLGSHTEKNGRLGSGERTVGITTVFTSEGRYLLDDHTAAVPFEQYPAALQQSLVRTINAVRTADAWKSSDAVRLVFHVFKSLKDREADAIERTVKELGLERVTFAFLHIVDAHPYMLFDQTNSGSGGYGGQKKGVFAPRRGTSALLSDREMLLSLTGSQHVKLGTHGTPAPLLLRLHPKSTFKDLRYLTKQAFDFSCHSWRMFDPSPLPITILYSELIAELLAGLKDVPGWDADAMRSRTSRTRWFL